MKIFPIFSIATVAIALSGCLGSNPTKSNLHARAVMPSNVLTKAEVGRWNRCVELVNKQREKWGYPNDYLPIASVTYDDAMREARAILNETGMETVAAVTLPGIAMVAGAIAPPVGLAVLGAGAYGAGKTIAKHEERGDIEIMSQRAQAAVNRCYYSKSEIREIQKKEIREIQKKLALLGFDPGPADGIFGRKTSHAISQYQAKQGLPVTGAVSRELLESLRQSMP